MTAPTATITILEGCCHVLHAFDVGLSVDLNECDRRTASSKQWKRIKCKRRAPKDYSEHETPPLRMMLESEPIVVGPFQTEPTTELVVHDFGAITVWRRIPLFGSLQQARDLSELLYDNAPLRTAAAVQVSKWMEVIGPAIAVPQLADVVEDYRIYDIRRWTPDVAPDEILRQNGQQIAQILRSEPEPLSLGEVDEALAARISFGPRDAAVIDWDGAFLLGEDADDVRTVLESANAELLEMRFLDRRLDSALEEAYSSLTRLRAVSVFRVRAMTTTMQRMSQMQVDGAILFERISNALKMLGDQYLARIYRLASQRFYLHAWDAGVQRKLQVLESIYQKLHERASTRRMEVLEWVIIILIAVSILLPMMTQH